MYYESRTEFLAARFFDTLYIQCISYYKLRSQHFRSIIEQNLRPEKGIYSYLVKFYRKIDTMYAEYTGLFLVPLLCPCVSSSETL